MNSTHLQIDTLGLAHFCIKNNDPVDTLRQNYLIPDLSEKQTVIELDWDFIYKEGVKSKRFLLLTDINDWSYLLWNYWDFQSNLNFATDLSKILKTTVNYYFIDSNIATSRWIFTYNGDISRAYFESHDQKLFDLGFNEIENNLRATIKKTFTEDIFWELYEKTCTSLEYVNRQKIQELKLYKGTLGNKK